VFVCTMRRGALFIVTASMRQCILLYSANVYIVAFLKIACSAVDFILFYVPVKYLSKLITQYIVN